ncbi:alpha-ribazole phosphatase [Trinickia fusca]|uniref:Alpha-ribazole phosphatase n=1 Tax=Trinickia fusca TaxID=2419777 RepID=A0A494X297_9BURK|nr:alpha-ribazole phosphatase [Trinickia fusca]RKP44845.1 alpha-ribazole phosphatase [Trinickia fusca]
MDLVLIRHPAPAVDAGVCYGSSDVPLLDAAGASAQALAERLAELDAPPPQALWTSPLQRCAQVAAPLAQHWRCAYHVDARLQEIDFGSWERKRWDAIDRAALDAWAADLQHARAHGGESVAQFTTRVGQWFDGLTAVGSSDEHVSHCHVVTHAGVMRALASLALGVPLQTALGWPLGMAAIAWLRREGTSGAWRLVHWNA